MPEASQDLAVEASILFTDEVENDLLPGVSRGQTASQFLATLVLIMADLACLLSAFSLAFIIRIKILPAITSIYIAQIPKAMLNRLWMIVLVYVLCLSYEGLYTKRLSFWEETKQLVKATTLAFLLMMAIISLGRLDDYVSRTVLVLSYFTLIVLLPTGRLTTKRVLARVGLRAQPVLILGAGKTGKLVANALLREKYIGYHIAGFLDDDPGKQSRVVRVYGGFFPVLGKFSDSDRIMAQTGARHLIVAAPGMPPRKMVELVNRLQQQAASVTVVPDLFGVPVMGVEADYSFDEQLLSFRIRNMLANPINRLAKQIFDFAVGALILIAVLPLMMIITIAIKLDSKGPATFSHRRVGRGGREFDCYKFRTMVQNSQQLLEELLRNDTDLRREWEHDYKLRNDPRVTRVGKFLRKTSLDELPQIFNVLKGEMSLVGPRPIVQKEVSRFGALNSHYFMVRPGITGLWQVSGRNDINYPERVRLEAWYVRNWSLWLDITLLIRTVSVVLTRRGAY